MARAIDADALLTNVQEAYDELRKIYDGLMFADERKICGAQLSTLAELTMRVRNAPTLDVAPVVHGEWMIVKVDATQTKFACSKCGRAVTCGNDYFMKPTKHIGAIYPFCRCGAKMEGEK